MPLRKQTGYPSKDKTHLKRLKFSEKHPFIPKISISLTFDLLSIGHMNSPVFEQRELIVTRREYIEESKVAAKALSVLGVKVGDIVAVATPNIYQGMVIFKACNQIGAITAFLDDKNPLETTAGYLNEFKSTVLITYEQDNFYANKLRKKVKSLKYIINISESSADKLLKDQEPQVCSYRDGFFDYSGLNFINKEDSTKPKKVFFSGNLDSLILYTSGSSGDPKSMVFTNESLFAASMYSLNESHINIYDKKYQKRLCVVPYKYPYGSLTSVISEILGGGTVLLAPDLCPENINYYYSKKPDAIFGTPAFLALTLKNLAPTIKLPNLKLFISGGDFLSVKLSKEATEFFKDHGANTKICNGYGVGEALGSVTVAVSAPYRPETVGRFVPGPKYLIIDDETNKEAKYDQPGRLYISGKHLMTKYFGKPNSDRDCFVSLNGDKYLKTSNIVQLDRDGYVTILGRSSYYINAMSRKVYYETTQTILSQIDLVEECCVVPKPDDEELFVSVAFVVLTDNKLGDGAAKRYLFQKMREPCQIGNRKIQLMEHEIPKQIIFMEELPRTAADKVDFKKLENSLA